MWLLLFTSGLLPFSFCLHNINFLEENGNFYDIGLDCDFNNTEAQEVKNEFHQSLKPPYIEVHSSPKNRRKKNKLYI